MELIPIVQNELDGTMQQTVNSREVYNFLKIKTEYSHWIRRTIEKFDFEEGSDYLVIFDGVQKKDYIVTMDMAKELCMITNTPKGKETRKYFIAAEKEVHKPKTALELIAEAMTQVQVETSQRLTVIEDKVDNLTINKTVHPKSGFASIGDLATKTGFSKTMVKLFIEDTNPKTCSASTTLPDGSTKPYTAYKVKAIKQYAKQVRKTAKPINENQIYYRSPLTGDKKFQL